MKTLFFNHIKTFVLMLSVAIFFMPLTGCNDDDAPDTPTNEDEEVAENQLAYFQSFLVSVDSLGNFTDHINGVHLSEFSSDPEEMFIGVDDISDARELFLSWMPDNANVCESGDIITFYPTDTDSKSQGTVKFTAISGSQYQIAQITLEDGASIPGVSKLNFINGNAWPENYVSSLSLGEVENRKHKDGNWYDFVCIREASKGQTGIMIAFDENLYTPFQGSSNSWMASKGEGRLVSKIVRENWTMHYNNFINAGYDYVFENNPDGEVNFDHWAYCILVMKGYTIRLKTGKEEGYVNSKYKFHNLYIAYFGQVKD